MKKVSLYAFIFFSFFHIQSSYAQGLDCNLKLSQERFRTICSNLVDPVRYQEGFIHHIDCRKIKKSSSDKERCGEVSIYQQLKLKKPLRHKQIND